eukprot:Nitzschia sp. Nitz4//scaffold13_size275219//133364//134039//NITZ4_000874-RA/size275219-processed-gene-0.156-mRNA-1//-1//CDS//3329536014//1052//frame0
MKQPSEGVRMYSTGPHDNVGSFSIWNTYGWTWTTLPSMGKIATISSAGMTTLQVHEFFMEKALRQAVEASSRLEVPVGAVLVQQVGLDEYSVLAEAYNQIEQRHDATAHAEILALRAAAHAIQDWRLQNTTLYSTLEPCSMCLAATKAFRVPAIVFGASDNHCYEMGSNPFKESMLSSFDVTSGVLADKSAFLLKSFFYQRRQQNKK